MKSRGRGFVVLAVILLLVLLPFVGSAQTGGQPLYRGGQVIVKFKDKDAVTLTSTGRQGRRGVAVSANSRVNKVMRQLGIHEAEALMPLTDKVSANGSHRTSAKHGLSQLYLMHFDNTKVAYVEEAVRALRQLNEVEYAEPNRILSLMSTDADTYMAEPRYSEQWGLNAIRMPELWAVPIVNTKRPVIAILDSGVDINHPDLKDNMLPGYNAYDGSSDVTDNVGHGTHCAGIVAAIGNNNVGIVGANPNAQILPIKIADNDDAIDMAAEIRGVAYAVEQGADIISMSFGYSDNAPAQSEFEALEEASHHAILVAAAGNDTKCMIWEHAPLHGGNPHPSYPAAFSFVIGVESSTPSGKLAEDSNYDCDGPLYTPYTEGYNYEIRAPGYDILSTLPNSDYGYMSGTSMACPLVAGALSRLLQCRNYADYRTMVRTLIESSGDCVDMMAAYQMTDEQLNVDVFTLAVDGVTMTFHKTSGTTVEIGDGTNPAISTTTAGTIVIPKVARGYLVTRIAANAFHACDQLASVVIPHSVASIGSSAFSGCSGLKYLQPLHLLSTEQPAVCDNDAFDESLFTTCSVEVAATFVTTYQTADVWKEFGSHIISPQYAVGDVFKETVDGVEQLFTVTCLAPRTVEISGFTRKIENVEDVLTKADSVSVRIPSEVQGFVVTKIGNSAFSWCCEMESLEIPETVTEIGGGAFYCCWGLRSLHIPASVKYIDYISVINGYGFDTFWNMRSLESVSVADGNPKYHCPDGSNAIMETATHTLLVGCKNTIIPEGTKRIGPCAFSHQEIGSVTIPEGVVKIDEKAFYAANLTEITLPESLREICYWGLSSNNLREIKLPSNLEIIGREALSSNSIRTLEIPASVKSIGQWAFVGYSLLRNVIVNHREPLPIPHEQTTDVFYYYVDEYFNDPYPYDHIYDYATLYVPQGCKAAYQNAEGWNKFKNIVEISDVIPGDIDGNGELNDMDRQVMEAYLTRTYGITDPVLFLSADEQYLRDYLEGNALPELRDLAADLNADGEIDLRDYVILVNLLAGESYDPNAEQPEATLTVDPTKISELGISNDAVVHLQSHSDITGMVLKITMPDELDLSGYGVDCIQLPERYAETHSVVFSPFGSSGNTRLYFIFPKANGVFSPTADGDDELLRIRVYANSSFDEAIGVKTPELTVNAQMIATSGKSVDVTATGIALPPSITFSPGQQWMTCIMGLGKTFVNETGVKAYAVTSMTREAVNVEEIAGGIPAYQMVLVGLDEVPVEEKNIMLKTADVPYYSGVNLLCGNAQDPATGFFPYETYVLYHNEFVLNSATTVPAGKGYIRASDIHSVSAAPLRLGIVVGGETTAISQLINDTNDAAAWYDLQGRRLGSKPVTKGIYLDHGRKVIIK